MELRWVIVILIFAAVFLVVEFVYYSAFVDARRTRKMSRRMALGQQANRHQDEVLDQLRRERWIGADGQMGGRWRRMVVQSGLRLNVSKLASSLFLASFFSFIVIGLVVGFNLIAAAGAMLMTSLLTWAYVALARARRIAKFSEQLPDAVDVMVRSLRAGHPVPVSLTLVAKEMADPAGSEFGMVSDEITYGSDLQTAMHNLEQRVGSEDLRFLVVSVSVQASTGGNLAEVLSNLSTVIRQRFKMRRKVRALSAEGRFSAMALSLLPFIIFGLLNLIAPSFYGSVWNHPAVLPALGVCGVMLAIGNFIMYRMVNFRF